ncbi:MULTISPECIES: glycoside hydrolase family 32 protein [Halanaerobium]|uniref:Fructan beta-fructosidase n=1 Tax=Halanaerobium kushneri TaxID=56779 RepID=A0A1N6TET2_9FIRM|nr:MULTISPECIES: glycoside hydrolase family 32 protein [Halanaerobium]RCW56205.1 levanase [Halanaerobium sp. ST460_2HS_T2]SIQ51771.1 fructan beta-fructosidase [Halanaerobium kushneri]
MLVDNLYKEKYRPQYHFSPAKNWSNDPNGLVFYQGEYHLFYQYNPNDVIWGPMHWGHAVSKDLIHWEHLPIALEPDDELGMIFSGSAVVDKNDSTGFFDGGEGLVAIYTTHLEREKGPLQQQAIAYSKDKGRSWTKYAGNPVIKNYGVADFRDPKVFWHKESQKWVMIVTCADRVRFYNSPDLKDWNYLSEFGQEIGIHVDTWECPDLIKMPVEKSGTADASENKEKWILEVGDIQGGQSGVAVQYFIGDFDGREFKSDYDRSFFVDQGQDIYALQSWSNLPDQREIWLGWMNNIGYMSKIPTTGWRGMMSIPRELSLKDDGERIKLIQKPITELKNLREKFYSEVNTELEGSKKIDFKEQSYEIKAELDFSDAEEVVFALHKNDKQESLLKLNKKQNKIIIDLNNSGNTDFDETFLLEKEIDYDFKKAVDLDIFIDRSSMEVFLDDGEISITDLVFPELDSEEIEIRVSGGKAYIKNLEVYKLNSIWD